MSAGQIADCLGVSTGTVWLWCRTVPDFPKPIRISARCTRWVKSDVDAWFESRRSGTEAKFSKETANEAQN
ncbi:helix-turn-helix transcriptional regulator [Pseudooceanicola sp. 200-1SW]|uniref:helix-turn-helix transcriptional regulator n=1 Tax=Pseudooceanicola sp. 200-1SW TaxID=3425949 RepID=UPI003D7FADA2